MKPAQLPAIRKAVIVKIKILFLDLNILIKSLMFEIKINNKNKKINDQKPLWATTSIVSTWFNSLKKRGCGSPQKIAAIQENITPLENLLFNKLGRVNVYSICIE